MFTLYSMGHIPSNRLSSIDVLRAITMFCMIFVNDLWTLRDIPAWLGHVDAQADGMGFADTVFPAFLVIVGLSIPIAIQRRLDKGDSTASITSHILSRFLALMVMGILHVNLEHYHEAAVLSKPVFKILLTLAFFLIWLDYPTGERKQKNIGRGLGLGLLAVLLILFKGSEQGEMTWLKTYWWGILGLIGWAYLTSSMVYLLFRGNLWAQVAALVLFYLYNALAHAHILHEPTFIGLAGKGAMAAFTTGGVVIYLIYQRLQGQRAALMGTLGGMGIALIAFGFLTRPWWGISKIGATPSWTGICTGLTLLVFMALIATVDWHGKKNWFAWIRPAGTSTLTCYLLPSIHYGFYSMIGWSLPLILRTGPLGIIKSMAYALAIILVTGILEKRGWRLKI